MSATEKYAEAAHRLWDELADRSIEHGDETLRYLLDRACKLIGADTGVWMGAVRMSGDSAEDALRGWRPRVVSYLHPSTEQVDDVRRRDMKRFERGSYRPELLVHVCTGHAHRRWQRAGRSRWHDGVCGRLQCGAVPRRRE